MERQSKRMFTRADVEAFFTEYWGKMEEPKNELRSIHLLPELSPPTWQVEYKATYEAGTLYEHTNFYDLLVVQKLRDDGKPYLNLPSHYEIPEGLETTAEEDAAIQTKEEN